jgi:hypothetical protein
VKGKRGSHAIFKNETAAVIAELAVNHHPGSIVGRMLFRRARGDLYGVLGDFGCEAVICAERFLLKRHSRQQINNQIFLLGYREVGL